MCIYIYIYVYIYVYIYTLYTYMFIFVYCICIYEHIMIYWDILECNGIFRGRARPQVLNPEEWLGPTTAAPELEVVGQRKSLTPRIFCLMIGIIGC